MPADTRRGGDVRTLLSPKTVSSKSGFMGVATLAPGDRISEHWHPFSEEFIYCVRGTITADLDGEPREVTARRGALRPVHDAPPPPQRGRRGSVHRLPPRAAGSACRHRTRRHRVAVRRTVVTGVGVVAPGGVTREAFWDRITSGKAGHPEDHVLRPDGVPLADRRRGRLRPARGPGSTEHEIRRMDRYIQFAAAAGMEAMADSGARPRGRRPRAHGRHARLGRRRHDGARGRVRRGLQPRQGVAGRPRRTRPPFLYSGLVPSSLASEIALKFGAHGPSTVISTGCTSGIDAIGYGHQLIQDGEADIVISGASESPISPISMACFDPIKATSRRNDDPEHASRPFDRDRDGFVMGEGGAVLILEEYEAAKERGAHVYCEVAGFASRGNAYHMTGLRPEAYAMTEAIRDAMRAGRHAAGGHRLHQRPRVGHEAERPPRDAGVQEHARRPARTRSRSARSSR